MKTSPVLPLCRLGIAFYRLCAAIELSHMGQSALGTFRGSFHITRRHQFEPVSMHYRLIGDANTSSSLERHYRRSPSLKVEVVLELAARTSRALPIQRCS